MRRAEARNLTWDYVLANHVRVVSTEENRTKDMEWRDIPISPGCCKALEMLWRDATDEYVLPRVHKDSLSRAFKKVLSRTGNVGNLHDLRHTFISHLVMQGVPLRTVQVLAGHSRIEVTEGYAQLAPNHMVDAVANLKI
jgi:integrase